MAKFKVGDVVVATDVEGVTDELNTASKYVVLKVYAEGIYVKNDLGQSNTGYYYDRFGLADPKLTPEEVLQYFKEGRQHELDYTTPDGTTCNVTDLLSIRYLTVGTWRIKPKTIDYYGTDIPKPVTKEEAEAEGLKFVFRPTLLNPFNTNFKCTSVAPCNMVDNNIYFRTESEALQVAEVLLKPF